jgi:hypothetical protein
MLTENVRCICRCGTKVPSSLRGFNGKWPRERNFIKRTKCSTPCVLSLTTEAILKHCFTT